ncbi:MAG: FtsQ-type POTRA domain-containing protein [Treponema sp.]|jgi:cell division protein FtsQ|nr:FtsQ-type POTRA domain-containing protein [Treponema sp.]
MSTDYTYTAEKPDTAPRGKISKGLKRLLIISGIIIAAELIWLFGISPFIPFSTIDIHTFSGLEKKDVLSLAGIDDTTSFASANVNVIKEKLSSHILVESVMIIKRFPDKLSIFLTPRQPAAVALTTINGLGNQPKQSLVYVDRQGVFFKEIDGNSAEIKIPVISGIENPQIYMRLPDALVSLTESLSSIAASSPELLAAISEVRIERKAWEGFELVLYPVHSSIKVRVENNLTEDTLRFMLLMLNVFDSNSQKPEEIDFRSGMGSYRIREQSS